VNLESLQSNWAVWLALAAVLIAVAAITPRLLERTSKAKLKRVVSDMKEARRDLRKTVRATRRAEKKVQKLQQRAKRVKPRVLQEAKDAVDDANALQKILNDKVMVTENHVRRVIHDEFPNTCLRTSRTSARSRFSPKIGSTKNVCGSGFSRDQPNLIRD
jgi:hypothetical protein